MRVPSFQPSPGGRGLSGLPAAPIVTVSAVCITSLTDHITAVPETRTMSNNPPERQFAIHRIYTKDVSFESPNAPSIFLERIEPKHEVNLGTKVNKISDETFEVILSVTVTTKSNDKTTFIVEVHQAGLFGVKGFSEQELGPLLGAYCPNLLYPYSSAAVTELITKGGFPQLVLQPVNFDALLAQRQQQAATKRAAAAGDAVRQH